jgi:hypothetical protein
LAAAKRKRSQKRQQARKIIPDLADPKFADLPTCYWLLRFPLVLRACLRYSKFNPAFSNFHPALCCCTFFCILPFTGLCIA